LAGSNNISGNGNEFFGYEAGYNNTTAQYGTPFIGYLAGFSNNGDRNIGIGRYSMEANTTGEQNTAVGVLSLGLNSNW